MVDGILTLALVLMCLGMALGMLRLALGPRTVDRVIAMDLLTVSTISLIALFAHFGGRFIYLDVAIVYGLLSFLGVLAVARYLEKGV